MATISTQREVDQLVREAASVKGRGEYAVAGSPGLSLRCGRHGSRWVLRARVKGATGQPRVDLGNASLMTLAEARDVAATYRETARQGSDPRGASAPAVMSAAPTVDELADRWLDARGNDPDPRERLSPRSITSYRNHLGPFRQKFGSRRAHLVTDDDLKALLDELRGAGKLAMATSVRRAVSALYSWSIPEKLLPPGTINPARDLPRRYGRATERDHKLSVTEVAQLYAAAGEAPWPFGYVIQLAILSGKRRSIVEGLKWSWRRDQPLAHFEVPGSAAGSKGHAGVLIETPAVSAILEAAELTSGGLEHVFARLNESAAGKIAFDNQATGADRVSTLNAAWSKVKRVASERFGENPNRDAGRLNDIRRAIQSAAADSGSFEMRELCDLLIGHKASVGVQAIYERSGFHRAHERAAAWWEHLLLSEVTRIDPEAVPAELRGAYSAPETDGGHEPGQPKDGATAARERAQARLQRTRQGRS